MTAVKNIPGRAEYVDLHNVVFAPEGLGKDKLVSVTGIYPSPKLYPADDLFLVKSRELYIELDGIREIEVFGLSPYGDDALIEALNQIPFVKVYVYNLKNNEEGRVWDEQLKTKHLMVDSSEIMIL